jgi:Ca2+-binding EF-hand superfamily protein
VPESLFDEWFRRLDRDGDGKIDMIEMAHWIRRLTVPEKQDDMQRERRLVPTKESIKAKVTQVTVGSIMKA